jgi:hypothetical protein
MKALLWFVVTYACAESTGLWGHRIERGEMEDDLLRAWRRGAIALAIPGGCLSLLALLLVGSAVSHALRDGRAEGVITKLKDQQDKQRAGMRPTIEYSVGGTTHQIRTACNYSVETFVVGQKVPIRYRPDRPQLGTLDSFRERWFTPVALLVLSLLVLALAWKAASGLPPMLHALAAFGVTIFGAILGMTVFSVLCVPGGFEIFAGAPPLVTLIGGMMLFFGTVPVASLGSVELWLSRVPARCRRCAGGMRARFVGRQLTYSCMRCGDQW